MGRRDGVRPCRRDCLRLVVYATRAASLSIVYFRRLLDAGGPVNGAAASCDGPSPIEPVMNGSFPVCDCPLAPPGMMQAVRAAALRPVRSGRAGIEPAKTVESRRFFVCRLSTFHDRARCSCAGRRRPEAALSRERAFVRLAGVSVRERGFTCACIALPIRLFVARSTFGPDDWAASL